MRVEYISGTIVSMTKSWPFSSDCLKEIEGNFGGRSIALSTRVMSPMIGGFNLTGNMPIERRTIQRSISCSQMDRTFNDIQHLLGIGLKDIPAELRCKIPEVIDFKNIRMFAGAYLEDLQEFRIAVHGEDNMVEFDNQYQNIAAGKNFFHFYLKTNENRSVYVRYGMPGHINLNAKFLMKFPMWSLGHNQHDLSQVSQLGGPFYVSCAPTEIWESFNDRDKTHIKNFFQGMLEENIEVIVDLRQHVRLRDFSDNFQDEDYLEGPSNKAGVKVIKKFDDDPNVRLCEYNGHKFFQIKFTNIPDNTFPGQWRFLWPGNTQMPQEMINLCRKLDKYCLNSDGSIKKIVMHCNGGLGRAPSVMVAYILWRAARMAFERGKECVCDWSNQSRNEVDGKLNLANVLRNAIVNGIYARSTFIQSLEQFKCLQNMAEVLAQPGMLVSLFRFIDPVPMAEISWSEVPCLEEDEALEDFE